MSKRLIARESLGSMVYPNTWKYLSIGLMAILAASFSIPQASAHINTNVGHMLQHIYNFVDGIEAKTDNLPSDPADQSLIDEQLESIQSDTDAIQTSIGDLGNDPGLDKKFYFLRDVVNLSDEAGDVFGGRVDVTMDCVDVAANSCGFTVENIRFFAAGLSGAQECDFRGLEIDGTRNPEATPLPVHIQGPNQPGSDANPLIEWGIGSVAAFGQVGVTFECDSEGEPIDEATLNIEVVGEMPQGADISVEMILL